jgi:hypothetical protein
VTFIDGYDRMGVDDVAIISIKDFKKKTSNHLMAGRETA